MEEIERKHKIYLESVEETRTLAKEAHALHKELESKKYTQKSGMRRNKSRKR